MAIDFSKLRTPSREEAEAMEAEAFIAFVESDKAKRLELSKRSITITLTEDISVRSTAAGDTVLTIHGSETGRPPITAAYWVPTYLQAGLNGLLDKLTEGALIKLEGYWKKREWRNRDGKTVSSWEFQAQFIRKP